MEESVKRAADVRTSKGKYPIDEEIYKYYLEAEPVKTKLTSESKFPSEVRKKASINGYKGTWLVRYADDFVIGTNNQMSMEAILPVITVFLKERGLTLSNDKTTVKK